MNFKDTIYKIQGFVTKTRDNNSAISSNQKSVLKMTLFLLILILLGLFILFREKSANNFTIKNNLKNNHKTKIELPDKDIDPEKYWRNYFEQERFNDQKELARRFKDMELKQDELTRKISRKTDLELKETKFLLKRAQGELTNASLQLKAIALEEEKRLSQAPAHTTSKIDEVNYETEVIYDIPKPAVNYVPEGTYFTGNLLGGIAVSTALNTPQDNAIPVIIRLTDRGNLSKLNKTDIKNCRIMGSAYGDISSERAIVRLEKMICESKGMYTTSKIAGQLYGPDGFNGIKGEVVATSAKHIKNAMIGGILSGLTQNITGKEAVSMSGSGIISSKKKDAKTMLSEGAFSGASTAGEMIAKYYLRQAESMSPVLIIPAGVRVNAQIIKGFYIGEISTHKKIKNTREVR